jgi:hypothetical protein
VRRAGGVVLIVTLAWCVVRFLVISRGWPLVNDAALMQYIVFLMQHGMAPYRQIGDLNLPGAYVPSWISLSLASVLGVSGAVMWRVMDAAAVLLCAAAMVRIARPYSWFAGVFAGALFALSHGRDGIGQAGQRDVWETLLLLWAVAELFAAMRLKELRPEQVWVQRFQVAAFGAFAGAATTVKPFGFVFLLCLAPLVLWQVRRRERLLLAVAALAGFCLPLLLALGFLLRWHATAAFWQAIKVQLPYHAGLADGSMLQLLGRSTVGSIAKLLLFVLVAAAVTGGWRRSLRGLRYQPVRSLGPGYAGSAWCERPERAILVVCVLLGLASFVAQAKGYSYQRAPYLGFLWLFAGLEFTAALKSRRREVVAFGTAAICLGVFFCAPAYVRSIAKARWSTPVTTAMEQAIKLQAGARGIESLNGEVQCIDLSTGCTDALLHLGLVEASGTIYDEFLFPQSPSPWGMVYTGPAPGGPLPAAVVAGRERLQESLALHAPRVILVSAWLFPEGPGNYRKLALWPWFQSWLAGRYVLVSQKAFSRAENGPMGFRVYVLRRAGVPVG